MNFFPKILAAGLIALGGIAFAQEATDPNVKARQDLMKTIGQNTKILGDMAGAKTPFDAVTAETAKADLIAASAEIGAVYETQATDASSEAKPEIWTNWEDFVKRGQNLNIAATALDASSAETIGAGMSAVGQSCRDCHSTYRM